MGVMCKPDISYQNRPFDLITTLVVVVTVRTVFDIPKRGSLCRVCQVQTFISYLMEVRKIFEIVLKIVNKCRHNLNTQCNEIPFDTRQYENQTFYLLGKLCSRDEKYRKTLNKNSSSISKVTCRFCCEIHRCRHRFILRVTGVHGSHTVVPRYPIRSLSPRNSKSRRVF